MRFEEQFGLFRHWDRDVVVVDVFSIDVSIDDETGAHFLAGGGILQDLIQVQQIFRNAPGFGFLLPHHPNRVFNEFGWGGEFLILVRFFDDVLE